MNREELINQAVKCGICDEYKERMETASLEELLKMYKNGMDFVTGKNYLTNGFILENFDKDDLHDNLIFVEEEIDLEGRNGTYVLNSVKGRLRFKLKAARIYVRGDSDVTISASMLSRIFVNVYDDAKVNLTESGSKVYCYRHGGEITTNGNVKLRDGGNYD